MDYMDCMMIIIGTIIQNDGNNIAISHQSKGKINLSHDQLPINTWSILFVVYNGSKLSAYINGKLVEETSDGVGLNPTGNLNVGRSYEGGNRYFKGTISDFEVYLRALLQEEIQSVYERLNRKNEI